MFSKKKHFILIVFLPTILTYYFVRRVCNCVVIAYLLLAVMYTILMTKKTYPGNQWPEGSHPWSNHIRGKLFPLIVNYNISLIQAVLNMLVKHCFLTPYQEYAKILTYSFCRIFYLLF